ncbi:class I SAM-dependent methyltransferase [bacterium]|nr:class I SAM-dependent methyltransferase [bacterium]
MNLENVNCPLCGQDNASPFLTGADRYLRLKEKFTFVRCCNCGLIYLNPRPTQEYLLKRYYPEGYFAYVKYPEIFVGDSLKWKIKKKILNRHFGYKFSIVNDSPIFTILTEFIWLLFFYRFKYIPPYQGEGRILDFGCGSGEYIYSLKSLGWDTYGIEINEKGRQIGANYGLRIYSDFKSASFRDNLFLLQAR